MACCGVDPGHRLYRSVISDALRSHDHQSARLERHPSAPAFYRISHEWVLRSFDSSLSNCLWRVPGTLGRRIRAHRGFVGEHFLFAAVASAAAAIATGGFLSWISFRSRTDITSHL